MVYWLFKLILRITYSHTLFIANISKHHFICLALTKLVGAMCMRQQKKIRWPLFLLFFSCSAPASTQLSWVSFIITLQHSIACWTYNLSGLVPEELSLKPIFGTKKGTFRKNEDRLIVWYSLVFQVRQKKTVQIEY